MITVETPLRSLQTQRELLQELAEKLPAFGEYVRGALAVIDWIEHGTPSPVEEA